MGDEATQGPSGTYSILPKIKNNFETAIAGDGSNRNIIYNPSDLQSGQTPPDPFNSTNLTFKTKSDANLLVNESPYKLSFMYLYCHHPGTGRYRPRAWSIRIRKFVCKNYYKCI